MGKLKKLMVFLLVLGVCGFLHAQSFQKKSRGQKPVPGGKRAQQEEIFLSRNVSPDAGSKDAPLLFCIGLHIEPLGAVPSSIVTGKRKNTDSVQNRNIPTEGQKERTPSGKRPSMNYNQVSFFQRHLQNIRDLAETVDRHRGKLTVQTQSPFTQAAFETGNTILADLEKEGHEMALHFHEDAHLGKNSASLPVGAWTDVMKEEIGFIKQAGVKKNIRYWSGGNLYPGVLEAGAGAGLDVMSDYKNPREQESDECVLGVNPWRPAGGPEEHNMSRFAKHDPSGRIVYLPDGKFPPGYFTDMREAKAAGDAAHFDFLTEGLESSLRAVRKDRVNVFHITLHPSEVKNMEVLDLWLTQVIDPLVKSGKVKWATFSEMADAYVLWEKKNPGVNPRSEDVSGATASSDNSKRGYITFAINIHDIRYTDQSADTILRLIKIFEKYKVRGDFYLTGPMVDSYVRNRPDVIKSLKNSNMTISFHVRPPHPIYAGFDSKLINLNEEELKKTLRDYETFRLNMETGEIDRTQPGGYTYITKVFGRPPVVVSTQNNNSRIVSAALKNYKELGAKMRVMYHETGTKPEQPFEWSYGLLVRPSDFSITRWKLEGEPKDSFWWNRLEGRQSDYFNPTSYLKKKLSEWNVNRSPFITSLIHENNFYKKGEAWQYIYYVNGEHNRPASLPYDLNATDQSRPRSSEEQEKIWAAYEEMVSYASTNLNVVTSEDIVRIAQNLNL